MAAGTTLSKCGLTLNPERLTTHRGEVTCYSCNPPNGRTVQSQAQVRARDQASYGDSHFPGLGVLKCLACGRPTRDHPIAQPCPYGVRA
jgi:hypothetical protein